MMRIRCKAKFKDMKHNNIMRNIGEEFIEDEARANDLISRGFAILVEEIKKKEPEVAVKETKKETATKVEKATKKNAKK